VLSRWESEEAREGRALLEAPSSPLSSIRVAPSPNADGRRLGGPVLPSPANPILSASDRRGAAQREPVPRAFVPRNGAWISARGIWRAHVSRSCAYLHS